MKKVLLLFIGLLLLSPHAKAQVYANFNTAGDLQGFKKSSDSDTSHYTLQQMTDPNNPANGVAAINFAFTTGSQHARLEYDGPAGGLVLPGAAEFLTYWVYLPSTQSVPDSFKIDTYAMPSTTWNWTEEVHYAVDVPKNKWYPLSFPVAQYAAGKAGFDSAFAYPIAQSGLQLYPAPRADSTWNGTWYTDNAEIDGANLPGEQIEQFNSTGTTGLYAYNHWGPHKFIDSIYQQATVKMGNTGGALAVALNQQGLNDWDAIGLANSYKGHVSSAGAGFTGLALTMWVFIPKADTISDSTAFGLYYQPVAGGAWTWTNTDYLVKNMPRDIWYPLSVPILALSISDSAGHYLPGTNDIGDFGIQFHYNGDTAHVAKGVVYVDNIQIVSSAATPPPPVWAAADFEAAGSGKNAGLQGFYVSGSAPNGKIARKADFVTSNGTYVLVDTMNFTAAPHKSGIQRDSLQLADAALDSTALSASFQIYLPNKFPNHAVVKFYLSRGATDSVAFVDTVGGASGMLKANQWNTMTINVDSLANAGKIDPTKKHTVGVVMYYPAPYDTTKWIGGVLFDNLDIVGLTQPPLVDLGVKGLNVVKEYMLYNNYPNPFNPSTIIRYDLPKDSKVVLQIYDILGREVTTLVNERQGAGTHEVSFNASRYASGVYFYKLTAGTYSKVQRMMLIK
ncbi:MAG TPA: T9SS type A sorting domain-containing protein [Candidatus Kryptonia bacterium]